MMSDLYKLQERADTMMKNLEEHAKGFYAHSLETKDHMARIQALPKGDPGDPGPKGDNTPVKGTDYFTEADKQELIQSILTALPQPEKGKTPKKGSDYFTPEDIKHIAGVVKAGIVVPKVDHEAIAEKAAKKVKGTISTKDVNGFEDSQTVLRHFIAQGSRHGAGDTVAAGSNVTITTNTNGQKVISAAGGSPTILVATGTVDNSNLIFTFVSAPTVVVVNGSQYRNGHGVTIVGTTATLDSPVGVGGDIFGF